MNVAEFARLHDEIARLHEELVKANGACADMAQELGGLLAQIETLEYQRDRMQEKIEYLESYVQYRIEDLEAKLSGRNP